MNDGLADRIRRAYPSGLIYNLDETSLVSDERDARNQATLTAISTVCPLAITVSPFDKPAYEITITQKDHPPFETWAWLMGNADKLAWIKSSNGDSYTAFWLKISRVADFYYCFYNHWVPRGDTGYLDADLKRKPNALWAGYEKTIRGELERNGLAYLTDDLAREETPFVLEHDYDSIPDDDPRWNEDGFEPPLIPSTVHECLFKH